MSKLKVFLCAVLAGLLIGIGGCVYLACENKVAGALLFTVGLFAICVNGLFLYTGKIGYVVNEKPAYLITLLLTWVGNFVGTGLIGYAVRASRLAETLVPKVEGVVATKLADNPFSIFILSIFCGLLMFIAVDGWKNVEHGAGKCMALFLGVSVFILAGFEHCIANMFYFSLANVWAGKTFLYLLIMTLGNSVGGVIIPLLRKVK